VKALSCHCHSNLPWDRGRAEAGFILAILLSIGSRFSVRCYNGTHLTDEDRAAQEGLLRQLTNRPLAVFLGGELDDSVESGKYEDKVDGDKLLTRNPSRFQLASRELRRREPHQLPIPKKSHQYPASSFRSIKKQR
jgi:hypothetical protein